MESYRLLWFGHGEECSSFFLSCVSPSFAVGGHVSYIVIVYTFKESVPLVVLWPTTLIVVCTCSLAVCAGSLAVFTGSLAVVPSPVMCRVAHLIFGLEIIHFL